MTYDEMIDDVMDEKPSSFSDAVTELYSLCRSVQMAIQLDEVHDVPHSETFLEQGGRLAVWLEEKGRTLAPPRRM